MISNSSTPWWQSSEDNYEWEQLNETYSVYSGSEDGCAPEMPHVPILEPSIDGWFWGKWSEDDILDTMLFISKL